MVVCVCVCVCVWLTLDAVLMKQNEHNFHFIKNIFIEKYSVTAEKLCQSTYHFQSMISYMTAENKSVKLWSLSATVANSI